MAFQHQIVVGEKVNFDPDNPKGPWTFIAPAVTSGVGSSDHGASFTINATTFGATPITLNASGTAKFDDPQTGPVPVASITGIMTGDALTFTYDSTLDIWRVYSIAPAEFQFSALFDGASNIDPGSEYTSFVGYGDSLDTPLFLSNTIADPINGIITAPRPGIYRLDFTVVFQQGNDNKELAAILWSRQSIDGDTRIDALQISDDKTNWRSMSFSGLVGLEQDETVQIGMSWVNQSMGNCSIDTISFVLEYVESGLYTPAG